MKCNLCPRMCNKDRDVSVGYCGMPNKIFVARAALHYWEEPCISGENGSGTVFFSGCNLGCCFCQNRVLAKEKIGKEITVKRLAEIFVELEEQKAHNINLVTGDHYALQIKEAVDLAKKNGFSVPVILNTSSYINRNTLSFLKDSIDIYLADFKYLDDKTSLRYANAPDYPKAAMDAIKEMVKNQPIPVYDSDGMMKKGVIVRHMILPGHIEESKKIIKYLFDKYGRKIVLSIMNQYTPIDIENFPEINRLVTQKEYDDVLDYAISIGVENAYIQEGGTADESFVPKFDMRGV